MSKTRILGKDLLKSIADSLYSNDFVLFREAIQNSSDAIDQSIKNGEFKDYSININIDEINKNISIYDNGFGVPSAKADLLLSSIGYSEKKKKEDRGYKGIGKISGLFTCSKIIYTTKVKTERKRSIVEWDCKKLLNILNEHSDQYVELVDVIASVVTTKFEVEDSLDSYFKCDFIDVKEKLLNIVSVTDYISRICPLEFNNFSYKEDINRKIKSFNKLYSTYKIFINNNQIFKPYKNRYKLGQKRKDTNMYYGEVEYTNVENIEYFEHSDSEGNLLYVVWMGITDFVQAYAKHEPYGLIIRSSNIALSYGDTFVNMVNETWAQTHSNVKGTFGEIIVFDENLNLNSSRMDFDRNSAYDSFKRQMIILAERIHYYRYKFSTV